MQPPAFVRPIGPTMLRALRVLTRLALTALVLTLAFGGTTAAPAEASFPASPQLRPVPVVGFPQPAARPVVAPLPPRPADEHADAPAAPARPAGDPGTTTTVTVPLPPPATDPGQGSVGRRGPPRV
ncbi:hypothetical protein CA850_28345 [Micromonospora echinospora]|uniref:Uncharacterized protein n=1 Tax=Micromonospora echinospora TaxID=1877 RepID=A0A1C4VQC8_MICEC|nr:hypothetical protein [Micromonospora echinospora]OZV75549.1 hypothetical protein CA850_28345 [Micromonospora echinospora]SCE86148.1 hypothetical protein GA0070618_1460 [Micromonospora echinospora]